VRTTVTARLTAPQADALQKLAAEAGCTIIAALREMFAHWLDQGCHVVEEPYFVADVVKVTYHLRTEEVVELREASAAAGIAMSKAIRQAVMAWHGGALQSAPTAEAWLRNALRNAPAYRSALVRRAKRDGVGGPGGAGGNLDKAARRLGVVRKRVRGRALWSLPPADKPDA